MRAAFSLLEIILAVALMAVISVFIYSWLLHAQRQVSEDAHTLRIRRDILSSVMLIRDDLLQRSHGEKHPLTLSETELNFHSYHFVPGDFINESFAQANGPTHKNPPQAQPQTIQYTLTESGLFRRAIGKNIRLFGIERTSTEKNNGRALWRHTITAVFEDDDGVLYLNISAPISLRLRLAL